MRILVTHLIAELPSVLGYSIESLLSTDGERQTKLKDHPPFAIPQLITMTSRNIHKKSSRKDFSKKTEPGGGKKEQRYVLCLNIFVSTHLIPDRHTKSNLECTEEIHP